MSAPDSLEKAAEDRWRTIPIFGEVMAAAEAAATAGTPENQQTFLRLRQYWLVGYPGLAPNTRACIAFSFTAMVGALRDPRIHNVVSSNTSIIPEAVLDGKIVILDFPINEFH